jgi:hypothetical protein
MLSRVSLVLFAALLFACGGQTADDDLGDGGPGNEGGPDGSPAPSPDCPTSPPAQGASCSKDTIECEYGSDPRSTCNQVATCSSGAWEYSPNDPTCPTPAQNPAACPATFDQVSQGNSCNVEGTVCNYTNASATHFCTCSSGGGPIMIDGGNYATWECGFGPAQGCPDARPRIGSACTQADVQCTYDVCGEPSGLTFQCNAQTSTWVIGMMDACFGAQ